MSGIEGLDALNKQLESLKGLTPKSMLAGAYTLMKYSMENAPVKTGFLKNSHSANETADGAEMVVSAGYAEFVEFGTSKWEGKPFVRPAIDGHSDDIVKAVAEAIQEDIGGKM